MVFSSVSFLFYFLPALLIIYGIAPKKLKNAVLTLGSLVFYAWGEIRFIPILIALSIEDYFSARMISKYHDNPRVKRLFVTISVLCNLGVLVFFKYANFFVANLNLIPGLSIADPNIMLPIGVSFNTFQSISYTVDVYRGRTDCERSYYNYLTFTTLFPQIIAGPIVRYVTVGEELRDHPLTADNLSVGLRRMITGLGKKVLIANNVGYLWSQVSAQAAGEGTVLLSWLGIMAYTLQIYFDFSGYSDIAIGVAKMFGLSFEENFNFPYISKSVTEFWRRWHMTLGSWFRIYVYIPLGGNRCSVIKHLRNLFVVWALTGLWHGASWNFVVWGIYFAVLLAAEKYLLMPLLQKLPAVLSRSYTMLAVMFGWAVFYFESLADGIGFLGKLFGAGGLSFADADALFALKSYLPIFIIAAYLCTPHFRTRVLERAQASDRTAVKLLVCLGYLAVFGLSIAYLVTSTYNPVLYFRF